jgi:23S rRNA (guanosine2251-2'-O)-methyltransferase
MRKIVLIAHNLRSVHNVGSLLRTAEGLGVEKVYLTGYTPHHKVSGDARLPHEIAKIEKQLRKTALDAEQTLNWEYYQHLDDVLQKLKTDTYILAAVEQSDTSIKLPDYDIPPRIALLVGREVEGVEPDVLKKMDIHLEIPMFGSKESFNVVQATAMALYHCKFR